MESHPTPLLWVGTDDGLIQVTEDGGKAWRKLDQFPGVPEMTYMSCLCASHHDTDKLARTIMKKVWRA